jgi:Flp pilus assembly protein TadG
MDTKDKEIGQTLIETVFVLALLLILIFGIAEFARAWYLKNSLNNASRVGARVAIVQFTLNGTTDPGGDSCGSGSDAIKMVIGMGRQTQAIS